MPLLQNKRTNEKIDAGEISMKSGKAKIAGKSFWALIALMYGVLVLSPALAATPSLNNKNRTSQANQTVDELMRLSGLEKMSERYDSKILGAEFKPKDLPAEQITMVRNIVNRVSEPGEFSKSVKQYLNKNFKSRYGRPLLSWYRSPVGKKIVNGENELIDPQFEEDKKHFQESLRFYPPREERLQLIEKLEKVLGLTDHSLDVSLALVRVLLPLNKQLAGKSTRTLLQDLRQELYDPVQEQILRNMLFAYRDLTDKEIKAYLGFVGTPHGHWFIETAYKGTKVFLGRVAVRVEDLMNQIVEEMETGDGESDILMEIAPPGQRYLFVRKRDPFAPLVDPKQGLIQLASNDETEESVRNFSDELKNLPPIPLEVYKNIKRTNPRLYSDLEKFGDLFMQKKQLASMDDEEYFQAVERYKNLIKTANESGSSMLLTPTQAEYDSISLVGVIWKNNQVLALVETSDKKGHTVKEGDLLGPNFGIVESIEKDQIYVLEQSRDYLGNILTRKKEIEFLQVSQEQG